jgi:tetratricopeptide (TPR) repeat protein
LEQLFQCLHQDLVALTEWLATAKLTQGETVETDEMDEINQQAHTLTHGPRTAAEQSVASGDDPEGGSSSRIGNGRLSASSALSAQRGAYYRDDADVCSEEDEEEGEEGDAEGQEKDLATAEEEGDVREALAGKALVEQEPQLRERTRSRPTADWLRLGELAERLDSLDDAVRAYVHAVKSLPTSYIALRRLLLLYTSCGRLAEALAAADELCQYLDQKEPTAVVVACVAQLLDEHGPDELRWVMEQELGQLHTAVGSAIIDAVARVSGIERGGNNGGGGSSCSSATTDDSGSSEEVQVEVVVEDDGGGDKETG